MVVGSAFALSHIRHLCVVNDPSSDGYGNQPYGYVTPRAVAREGNFDMSAPVPPQAPRRRLWRLLGVATLITTGTLVLTAGTASAATPAGTYAYVTNTASATVSVVNTGTNSVIATVPVGNEPVGIATDPGGTRVYVTNSSSNTVSVIDTATNTVTATIAVGQRPQAVAVAPDSSRMYVANDGIATSTNTNAPRRDTSQTSRRVLEPHRARHCSGVAIGVARCDWVGVSIGGDPEAIR